MSSFKRRVFITLLGAAAWPFAARAQQATRVPRIGIIDDSPAWDPFRQGLRDVGYQEGQNIAFEYRYANGLPTRLAEAAAELVDRRVDLIATFGTPQTQAAKQATTTIPIVMIAIGDPVGTGLVASINRPGGNITGPSLARTWLANGCSSSRRLSPLFHRWPFFGIRIMPPILPSSLSRELPYRRWA